MNHDGLPAAPCGTPSALLAQLTCMTLFSQIFLYLFRACLGKKIVFMYKLLKKRLR
jgi:hypothetical protein